jgi:hypothetical protein
MHALQALFMSFIALHSHGELLASNALVEERSAALLHFAGFYEPDEQQLFGASSPRPLVVSGESVVN